MSEHSGASTLAPMTLEEPGAEQASPRAPGPLRCGPCAVWPRQQTWLCAVPLVMGFVGLGLSLMLLKWIVVGSVQDYVPTDLVDPKGSIGQDPIFLSKPSAMPKGPDISTATTSSAASTTALVSTTSPLAADGAAPIPRTRSEPPANHSANGSVINGDGNRVPHLHNRVGTRISGTVVTTTRASKITPSTSGKEVTPRSAVSRGSGVGNGRNRPANSKPGQTSITTTSTVSTTTTGKITTRVQPTASQSSTPIKPTRWNHGRQGKAPATRPQQRFRTPIAPTFPSLRSEVFKPCVEDKDLAFCLNEGECSIIETVAGVHRHCRCKEGYHGLRCDQFVPKTDAILSDPTDELGIEFMESGDTYQRQVLSIFSIASGICLLGVACMALYSRNKKHREKLQAHFSDGRNLGDSIVNMSSLMSKSMLRNQYNIQLQKSSTYHGSSINNGNASPGAVTGAPPILSRPRPKGKHFRSNSLSLSPSQHRRETIFFKTPPISRGKLKISTNLINGSRVAANVYKHLQEDESRELESIKRCDSASGRVGTLLSRTSLSHFASKKGWTEVPCTHLDKGTNFPPTSLRTRSVPIIPSLQAGDLEGGHSEMTDGNQEGLLKWHPTLAGKTVVPVRNSSSPTRETVVLLPGNMPNNVCPPAITSAPSSTKTCRSIEITGELAQELKQKSQSISTTMSGSHKFCHSSTDTLEAGTVHESKGKRAQHSARVLHTGSVTRDMKAEGQRESDGQSQGQTSMYCFMDTKGPSCRGAGNTYEKPSAS